jgi:integrase/recombinase XerD
VTRLRKLMLDELQRRNYSQTTVTGYIKTVADFAKYFQRPPDQLEPDEIRQYRLYLLNERKQGVRTVGNHTAALRFFFCKTLKRNYPIEEVPYPRAPRKLPIILTQEEAVRLIDSASNLFHRAMLMTLYSTGMRRAELCHLKVEDIDSARMVLHIRKGKGGKDRDVPLCPRLLETLREYWRWKKPKTWLFPGQPRAEGKRLTDKAVWYVCQDAARHAGIKKRVSPHMLRHASAYYTTFESAFILKVIALGQAQTAAVYGRYV